ncbi:MAG: shikimate kinase AroK [Gammaproteobacteria bacterium]|nr:shikimate kinase AroK [Gammaproteobacteria bacterium]
MNKAQDNIFLIGPMGSGKTTVGRHLAKTLKLEFVDSDHAIEERTGADIPWIFDIEGEEGFRRRERAVIDELTRRRGIVLATGGGAVIDPLNRADLAARGVVVFLRASVDKILSRTGKSQNRPLLRTENPRARVEQLLAARDALYHEIADIIVDTDKRGVKSTVNQILDQLRRNEAGVEDGKPRPPRRPRARRPEPQTR